jgi:hypothetical protein
MSDLEDKLRDYRRHAGGNRDRDSDPQTGFSETPLHPIRRVERKSALVARGKALAYFPALRTLF